MVQAQIDIAVIAAFIIENCDYSALYEADEFVVEIEGGRTYVERKRNWFVMHVGKQRIRLPRF